MMKKFILSMSIISLDHMKISTQLLEEETIYTLLAGDEQSYRVTGAYDLGGIIARLDHLMELVFYFQLYMNPVSMGGQIKLQISINAEKTTSFDIGYETYFNTLDLGFNITYFDILS